MKIINKDDCLQALNAIKMYGGINIPLSAFDTFDRLIEEHFSPQPLKFEDLTPGMWVWDNFFTTFTRLENTYLYSDDALAKETKMTTFYCDAGVLTKPFEENRYYPVQIPWEGNKKQWERTIESCKQ